MTDRLANTLHVHPTADLVEHDTSTPEPDCVCGWDGSSFTTALMRENNASLMEPEKHSGLRG